MRLRTRYMSPTGLKVLGSLTFLKPKGNSRGNICNKLKIKDIEAVQAQKCVDVEVVKESTILDAIVIV